MLRTCCRVVATLAVLAFAACGGGPNDPMPGDDDMMLIPASSADTVSR